MHEAIDSDLLRESRARRRADEVPKFITRGLGSVFHGVYQVRGVVRVVLVGARLGVGWSRR